MFEALSIWWIIALAIWGVAMFMSVVYLIVTVKNLIQEGKDQD